MTNAARVIQTASLTPAGWMAGAAQVRHAQGSEHARTASTAER
ncbi:hypothetical protein [Amycolatopsis viridis]|uniref:Uncharacterized protein n=1 Tax=Amycolatopsis viridis TaxID=185678 RepID=A0ABX0SR16_9PSEU|nr:hypothetical protein [Amycolatopsis viridis]NIH78939.1 hypothetical protein [Amycolatopsis viridis]